MTPFNILLIDDHATFRAGLKMLLKAELNGPHFFEAHTINEALSAQFNPIGLVLLDIEISNATGLSSIGLIKAQWPNAKVIVFSAYDDLKTIELSLECGADGFLSKTEQLNRIVNVILRIMQEQSAGLTPALSKRKFLTPRQQEILDLLRKGLSNKHIAKELTLSDNTVRRHVQDILSYYNVSSRSEAVFAARGEN